MLLLLQIPAVQGRLTSAISKGLSAKFDTRVNVGRVNYFWYNRISLSGFLVEDQHRDTLLYAGKLITGIDQFNLYAKKIRIANLVMSSASVNLVTDSARNLNLNFLIEKIKGNKDSTSGKWTIRFGNIEFRQSKFRYRSLPLMQQSSGINFSDIQLHDFYLRVKNLDIRNDTVHFSLNKLSFHERSGFYLEHMNADLSIHKNYMIFTNAHMVSENSDLNAAMLAFRFGAFKDFVKGSFGSKVKLNFDVQKSELDLKDLAYFTNILGQFQQKIQVSGKIRGVYSDMQGRDISIQYNHGTRLKARFNITGLPNVKQTFLYADIARFQSTTADLESIMLKDGRQWIKLPENLRKVGKLAYTGNFTGFFDDFVAYGTLETGLGLISTDLLIKPDTAHYASFSGKLATTDFDLGRFMTSKTEIGKISMNVQVDGNMRPGRNIKANVNGLVRYLFLYGYNYQNIKVEGTIANNAYDGNVSVEDPNIKMDFSGRLDFAQKPAEFDFSLNIPRIHPYNLHLIKTDSLLTASALVIANFQGSSIDSMNGDIKVLNSVFTRNDKPLKIYNITLSASSQQAENKLNLKSDFLDAAVEGNYSASELVTVLRNYMNKYLPSLFPSPAKQPAPQNFAFRVKLKKTDDICSFFLPRFKFAEATHAEGTFSSKGNYLKILAEFPALDYGALHWDNLYLNVASTDTGFSLESGSELLTLKKQIRFDNLSTYLNAARDSAWLNVRSLNWDTVLNKGALSAVATFSRIKKASHAVAFIHVNQAEMVSRNIPWRLKEANMIIDSSSIAVDEFSVYNERQNLSVYGRISHNSQDRLNIDLGNLRVSNINLFTAEKGFNFEGNITGKAVISDVYTSPVMLGAFDIDTLKLNGEVLGVTAIETKWNNDAKKLEASLTSLRGDLKTLKAFGYYSPLDHTLDFGIDLDKLRLNVMRPYLAKVVTNLGGLASGHLKLSGDIIKPLLNGDLLLQKATFLIPYLKTTNSFTGVARFKNSDILVNHVEVYDVAGNKAIVNGKVGTNFLKKLNFNLTIDAQNYTFLNTGAGDNDLFYGKAYGTGKITIAGPPENIVMNITARSDKNTQIFIPLTTSSAITESNFITFVSKDQGKKKNLPVKNNPVNVSGLQMNFDLTITPDAEMQLIFDPKIGDIMKGNGNGNIKMEVNTLGDFKMYGDYTITQGEYLFTLKNVINKRFKVDKGGQIQWNGDPRDAIINIKAIYSTKASLYNLLVNETTKDYKKRIPIDCQIFMTNKLMHPDLRFGIYLPTADEETRSRVSNAISTGDEMTKQFLSLLVINNFMPDPNRMPAGYTTPTAGLGAASVGVTTSELLSNQLSNWLSQISKDFDIGLNYRPEDQISGQEMEVALSTQILNDRVTIHTNLDVSGNQATTNATNTNNIVGDFDVGIKLNQSGKLNLKVFNRTNNIMQYDYGPYTQGVGISFNEDFNSIGELLRRYRASLRHKNEPARDSSSNVNK